MTSTRTRTHLPTVEQLDTSRKTLADNYNQLEDIEMLLVAIHEACGEGEPIDCTIDDAVIGSLYRYLSDVDAELEQAQVTARTLRGLLHDLDLHGRDIEIQARMQAASVDA